MSANALNQDQTDEMRLFLTSCGEVAEVDALIEFARDPSRALHTRFTWDDAVAADRHRRNEARATFRAYTMVRISRPRPEPRLLSLTIDRATGGGYRRVEDIRQSTNLVSVARNDAIREVHKLLRRLEDLECAGGQPVRDLRESILAALSSLQSQLAA